MRRFLAALAALPVVAALLFAGPSAQAATTLIYQAGSGASVSMNGLLPGAGTYQFDFERDIDVFFEVATAYTYHWDFFVAPPPKPHSQFVEGNSYTIDGVSRGTARKGTVYFHVPATTYTYFTWTTPSFGPPVGTLMYNEVKADNPRFYFHASETSGAPFNYTFRVSAIPEPAAWALLITGFGMAGAALRGGRRTGFRAA